jgi:hypothetical protein
MTPDQQIFLELLSDINKFKAKCKRLNTPPELYVTIGKLFEQTSEWGIENLVEKEDKELERR